MMKKNIKKSHLVIVTTVPDTMAYILAGQPKYLNKYLKISLVTSPGAAIKKVERHEELHVECVAMERGISPFKDLKSIFHMWRVLRKIRPSIVHSYTPKAGLISMVSAKLCGIPIRIHTFTGLIFPTSYGLRKNLLIWVDRLICFCATHVIPEGAGVQRDLESNCITNKPLRVIGNGNIAGVDTEHFKPDITDVQVAAGELGDQLNIKSQEMIFCFIGRLNKDKGIGELFSAFDALPEKAHLLLVGTLDLADPISEALRVRIEEHPRIHVLGFMEDIRPALSLADVLVLPSYREGFPNVLLQAGSMALPVIATNINGCNEVIEPGLNGWLVPPRNKQALMAAMQEAIKAPSSSLEEMGKRARKRVQQCFEQRQHWERMKIFYQALLRN